MIYSVKLLITDVRPQRHERNGCNALEALRNVVGRNTTIAAIDIQPRRMIYTVYYHNPNTAYPVTRAIVTPIA